MCGQSRHRPVGRRYGQTGHRNRDRSSSVSAARYRRREVILGIQDLIAGPDGHGAAHVHLDRCRQIPIVDRDVRAAGLVLIGFDEGPNAGGNVRRRSAVTIPAGPTLPAA